jgi:hypothetical protein
LKGGILRGGAGFLLIYSVAFFGSLRWVIMWDREKMNLPLASANQRFGDIKSDGEAEGMGEKV